MHISPICLCCSSSHRLFVDIAQAGVATELLTASLWKEGLMVGSEGCNLWTAIRDCR